MFTPIIFVENRAEIDSIKKLHEEKYGNRVFQTRTKCLCTSRHNSRRAIIVIEPETEALDLIVIECKRCRNDKHLAMSSACIERSRNVEVSN